MHVVQFQDPEAFLEHTEPVLLENELLNNFPLGILYRLVSTMKEEGGIPRHGEGSSRLFLATVQSGEQPLLILIQTLSHLILYASGEVGGSDQLRACCSEAVDYIIRQGEVSQIPSIIGLTSTAQVFAEVWRDKTGISYHVGMNQRIYRCTNVNPISESGGQLREAGPDDIPLITNWVLEFSREALEPIPQEDAERIARRGVSLSSLYIWDDGGPVSMVQKSRPTQRGIVVTLVYTPPELRGRGYASSSVAELTRRLLSSDYEFTCLYTDLSNPVSNHIYMNIGYEPAADSIVYVFDRTGE
ncbi:GNAT family N-acetyltransferase [Paenibacillus cineris]|uniref:Acetyltransferase n=1 Tax=Paenibacillus cineris TaxID=237530 RepID=A0ABQ4L916_9BACL|nr:GNAT family N-acetyltransferase [Paenibacillus cineris]GIO53078.1 acetyltransferase [Paenibacillus cineris]